MFFRDSKAASAWAALAALAALAILATAPLGAKVLLTPDEALALAFGDATVERGTAYLTAEQVARAGTLAGAPLASALVHPYRARRDGVLVGTAYFDTHRVRTLAETLMVVVDPA